MKAVNNARDELQGDDLELFERLIAKRNTPVEVDELIGIFQALIEVGAPARDSVFARERGELDGVAPDQDRLGPEDVTVGLNQSTLLAHRDDRANEMLIGPHAAGDAVHDDPDGDACHS